jgi:hypothetical protein
VKVCQRCKTAPRRAGVGKANKPFRLCEQCYASRRFCVCGNEKADEAVKCQQCYLAFMRGENHPSWTGGRIVNREGYVKVRSVGHPRADRHGYVWEHWLVIEAMLGRTLTSDENVHHLNGIRDDNRLENLELWTKSQPAGQRVSDKVAWAKEIIGLYEVPAADQQGRLPIAVDFDDTLATSLWAPDNPTTEIGEPIQVNIVKVRELARRGWNVVIFTARAWRDEPALRAWLTEHDVPFTSIVCAKPLCAAYCDDRAIPADAASYVPPNAAA